MQKIKPLHSDEWDQLQMQQLKGAFLNIWFTFNIKESIAYLLF